MPNKLNLNGQTLKINLLTLTLFHEFHTFVLYHDFYTKTQQKVGWQICLKFWVTLSSSFQIKRRLIIVLSLLSILESILEIKDAT